MRMKALFAQFSPLTLTAVLAMGGSFASAGDVYMWTEKNCQTGKNCVHYSDVPVEGAVLVKRAGISVQDAASSSAANAAAERDRLAARSGQISDQLDQEGAARGVDADLAKKRAQQCKEATERYERSIAARRLFRETKEGERVYLNEQELAAARVTARSDRDAACGAAPR